MYNIFGGIYDELIRSDRTLNAVLRDYPVVDTMPVYVFDPAATYDEIAYVEKMILEHCPNYTLKELKYDCEQCGWIAEPALSEELLSTPHLEYKFDILTGSYSVIGIGTVEDYDVVIPETFNGMPVTKISSFSTEYLAEDNEGKNNDVYLSRQVFSITIPESITSIEGISGCNNLIEVYNKSNLNISAGSSDNGNIAYYAKNVYTPESGQSNLIYKGNYVYYNDNGTYYLMGYIGAESELTLPENINGNTYSIGEFAFYGCTSLTSITIPESVTSMSNSAFSGCTSLTSIMIPDSVTSIGNYAFFGCDNLASIAIPESVTSISNSAFSDCASLTSITIPESVTSIGNYAFSDCASLTSITIPESVTSISNSAFSGCTSLTSITIPQSVTSISNSAFYGCTSLTSITIPDSVTSIGEFAFYGCTNLTSIAIPESVTSIGNYAFSGCDNLASIAIPESVTSIGIYAFSDCASLTSITIPESVTSIGNSAFEDCTSLASITIPDSVTSIGNSAFYGCNELVTVNYAGTEEQWNEIAIADGNDCLINATINYNYVPEE